jgi:hypothetical protein
MDTNKASPRNKKIIGEDKKRNPKMNRAETPPLVPLHVQNQIKKATADRRSLATSVVPNLAVVS